MRKRTKNIISFILTVCLLLSVLPSAATATTATTPAAESTAIEMPAVSEETTAVQEELPILQLEADCQILNHVDAETFAAGNHIARLPEDETLSSYVFLNADGSKTAYFMDQPVKFESADGTVVEKNLTLTVATEGYTTTQNDVRLTIPTDPASGIRMIYDNHTITLIPQGGTLTAAAQATDSSVTYPDYYGAGMSLRYTPTLSGVKEDILLDAYSGVNSFTFRLNTGGLNLYQAAGRYFLAESKTSTERILLGDVVAYDAKSKFSMGTLTSQTVMAGQAYLLTLTVDEAFLTDENTTYPVTIDPTLEVSYSQNGDGYIIDAPIFEGYPNYSYGTFIYNRVGNAGGNFGVGRTVVKLPVLTSSSIYASLDDTDITKVEFYAKEATGTGGISVSVYPLTTNSTWTGSNVTWHNVGSWANAATCTGTLTDSQWTAFNITSMVKDWKNGTIDPGCGFIMIGASTTLDKSFCASEHTTTSYRPYVVMTYSCNTFYSNYSDASYYCNTVDQIDYLDFAQTVPVALYNDDGLQLRANCYGYAFRFSYGVTNFYDEMIVFETISGNTMHGYKQTPGEFADKTNGLAIYNGSSLVGTIYTYDDLKQFVGMIFNSAISNSTRMDYLVQLMQADANTLGYTLTEYTGTTIPDASLYRDRRLIAVVISDQDFHFYMQHSDNSWSHKPGITQTPNQCIDCNLALTNANIKNHACEGYYAGGALKFFYITKDAIIDGCHFRGTFETTTQTSIDTSDRAGNHLVAAKNIGTLPQTCSGSKIDFVGDIDYYAFLSGSSQTYSLSASMGDATSIVVKLYNQQGNVIYTAQSSSGEISSTITLYSNRQYYISVEAQGQTAHKKHKVYSFSIVTS